MKIKKCSDFINEEKGNLNYLYHSTEPNCIDSIFSKGLNGKIYLTKTPEEAKQYHPIVLKIMADEDNIQKQGNNFIIQNIPVNNIVGIVK